MIVTTDLKRDMEDGGAYLMDCPHPSICKLADLVLYIYDEATYDPETKSSVTGCVNPRKSGAV